MRMKKSLIVVLFLVIGLAACQDSGLTEEGTPGAEQTVVEEPAAVSEPVNENEGSSAGSPLEAMLAFLPVGWADFDLVVPFGPAIHFIDVEQLREDVGIGPVTGASDPAEKRDLAIQMGLSVQGIVYGPDSVQPAASSAFDEWGWDIADVHQILYLPDIAAVIYKGDFGRLEIQARLQEKGYAAGSVQDFDVFTSDANLPAFAFTTEIMIAGGASDVRDLAGLISRGEPGLDTHPAVQVVLEHLEGVWGAVLAPSPDLLGYAAQVDQRMDLVDDSIQDVLEERFSSSEPKPIAWDFMAIGFQGEEVSELTVVYYYPTGSEADAAVPVVERFLTEMPSLNSPGTTWGDLMMVEEVRAEGSAVVATARTEVRGLIGNAFKGRDFFAFLPVE